MDVKDTLMKLSSACGTGGLDEAAKAAVGMLSEYGEVTKDTAGNIVAQISAGSGRHILLDAHIDEIGFMVTSVDENGFVSVTNSGGIDVRLLAASEVVIHGRENVRGVFCSTPPHLASESDAGKKKLSDMHIDTGLGEKAQQLISVGDRVTFFAEPASLLGGRITGKSFDNRAGVASLIMAAELLSKEKPQCRVSILLSVEEELGCRGAKSAAFRLRPDEAVSVDVSFAKSPGTPQNKTGFFMKGPMIGISPVLSSAITQNLISAAKEKSIPYQLEAMGGSTSTNADVISTTAEGIPTGLVSIPLRYMHTPVEVIDISDVENTARLLCGYIMKGGMENA